MALKISLLLIIAISGAMGQLQCSTSAATSIFNTARDACGTTHIGSQTATKAAFTSLDSIYSASSIFGVGTEICANKAASKSFLTCLDTAARVCVASGFHSAMPTATQLSAGVDYLCNNILNIDTTCYAAGINTLGTCVTTATANHGHNTTTTSGYKQYICLYVSETGKCLKSTYSSCTAKPNTGTLLQGGMTHVTPATCDGVVNSVSMILLLAVSVVNVITW